jgi:hypothetical protein
MTEPTLKPASHLVDTTIRTVCQLAMWAIVGLKIIWLAMALVFVGLQWQILLFACALVILALATWSFHKGNRSVGLGLTWLGVLIAIAVGYFGGFEPGPLTDRIHEQFRSHIADFVFLAVAHLQFWELGHSAHKPALPANVS